ncbi:TPA: hypothetical protein N0F65_002711 [Lagenidium giganteum]|uniref:Uncharacterized protein n=1 Tax=Lagenidium giganteum TaxID=4803 RepID=A0AAV2Z541_9STRA|nr:TPA: hypothetical protein N0F65_002711 [Lagenidium giganteum]
MHKGLVMEIATREPAVLDVMTDADYANEQARKSVSGYATFLNGSLESYGSRKQELNAQSTMEAEYLAINEGVRDVIWLRKLCKELWWQFAVPDLVRDNHSALALTEKPGKHS